MKEPSEKEVIGQRFEVDFGDSGYTLHFVSENQLEYKGLKGAAGESGLVIVRRVRIHENVHLVSWQESDKTTVTHLQDFDAMIILSVIFRLLIYGKNLV